MSNLNKRPSNKLHVTKICNVFRTDYWSYFSNIINNHEKIEIVREKWNDECHRTFIEINLNVENSGNHQNWLNAFCDISSAMVITAVNSSITLPN